MTFTIFKKTGEIHFDHDGIDDYDGDTGEEVEIEESDGKVRNDLAELVYYEYIRSALPVVAKDKATADELIKSIAMFIRDFALTDRLLEEYRDELQYKYSEEYNDCE